MIVLVCHVIAVVTFCLAIVGGILLLTRSIDKLGRIISVGFLSLALWQASFYGFISGFIAQSLPWLFVGELGTLASFLLVLSRMERNLWQNNRVVRFLPHIFMGLILVFSSIGLFFPHWSVTQAQSGEPVFHTVGFVQNLIILIAAVSSLWLAENILRALSDESKRSLKYPLLGVMSISGAFLTCSIYRLGMGSIHLEIMLLATLIMMTGMGLILFFSARNRVFDADVFVSRYVVYHSLSLLSVGLYLFLSGIVIFGVHSLGLQSSFVIKGFLLFCILLLLLFLIISPELRNRMKYFINTNFFADKYDFRKEWGELSQYLCIATSEAQIINVAAQVILESMYIRELSIWLRDDAFFTCMLSFPRQPSVNTIAPDHPFLTYLEWRPFLRSVPIATGDRLWERIVSSDNTFLEANNIELAVPITAGNTLIGFIAVGKENVGAPYGFDDIDLLSNVAAQCGAAIMQARFAQKLAENKEIDTYNFLSSSLLHDLKNAAGHLSLVLQNAPQHIDQKDFQEDMLETISQALARIGKVINKLGRVPDSVEIYRQEVNVDVFIITLLDKLKSRLTRINITKRIEKDLALSTDPEMLERMLENLIVNACEAMLDQGEIIITASRSHTAVMINVADNGPGMPDEFIENSLFKPFQTTKSTGSGLGLWQVKNMAQQVGARVDVNRRLPHGMAFSLVFPLEENA